MKNHHPKELALTRLQLHIWGKPPKTRTVKGLPSVSAALAKLPPAELVEFLEREAWKVDLFLMEWEAALARPRPKPGLRPKRPMRDFLGAMHRVGELARDAAQMHAKAPARVQTQLGKIAAFSRAAVLRKPPMRVARIPFELVGLRRTVKGVVQRLRRKP